MTATEYAKTFIGIKYNWAGNTPEQGFDCSGFICEALRPSNVIKNKEDLSSRAIYQKFKMQHDGKGVRAGSLLFFGEPITHIALAISPTQLIEAGGEGSRSTDGGFVRVRNISYRKDLKHIINLDKVR